MVAGGAYDAFISYSHSVDGRLAPALRTGLEQLAKPWRRRRALRVFQDASGLGATPGLWSTIAAALDRSSYFLLLASPAAAASHWVQQEVAHFRQLRGAQSILLVVTDGECHWDDRTADFDWSVTTAVPGQLSRAYGEEPFFVDLRWARVDNQLDLHNPHFRQAVGDLAAPIHGVPRDEIDARDLREYRQARRVRRLATAGLATVTAAATVAAGAAVVNADRARTQERLSDAGRLAALSTGYAPEQTDLAILLALHSRRRTDTREGRVALTGAMTRPAAGYGLLSGTGQLGRALAAGPSLLAAGDGNGRVAVWPQADAHGAGPVRPRDLTGHTDSISELSFSADERRLASVDAGGGLVVHEVASGSELLREGGVADATFTPDGALVLAGLDGSIEALAPDGALLWRDTEVAPASASGSDRLAIAASADGRWVAAASPNARIELLHAVSGAVESSWPTGGRGANDVAFNPASTALVAAGDDGLTWLWSIPGHKKVAEFGGALAGVRRVAWSSDGATAVAGGFDGRARLYDVTARRPIGELTGHVWPVGGLAYGADGTQLWTGDADTVRAWNLATSRPDAALGLDEAAVTEAEYSSDGALLATLSTAGLALWRPGDGHRLVAYEQDGGLDLAVTPDGSAVLVVGADGLIRRFATSDGSELESTAAPSELIWGVDVSPDGKTVATIGDDGAATAMDAVTGRQLWRVPVFAKGRQITFTVDGSSLVSIGFTNRDVVVLDAATGAVRQRWTAPREGAEPSALAMTPDGSSILVGRRDGRLDVLDAATLQVVREITAHQNAIYAIAVSPDSTTFATGGFNGGGVSQSGFDPGLRLWDAATGQQVSQLTGHDGQVEALAFSPDGHWLVSGGFDRSILLWPAFQEWLARACEVAGRDLTDAERQELLSPADSEAPIC